MTFNIYSFDPSHQKWDVMRQAQIIPNNDGTNCVGQTSTILDPTWLACESDPCETISGKRFVAAYAVGCHYYLLFLKALQSKTANPMLRLMRPLVDPNGVCCVHLAVPSTSLNETSSGSYILRRCAKLPSTGKHRIKVDNHSSELTVSKRAVSHEWADQVLWSECFKHFVFHHSHHRLVVEIGRFEKQDCVIEEFLVQFEDADGADTGISKFLQHHRCNSFCKALRLPVLMPL